MGVGGGGGRTSLTQKNEMKAYKAHDGAGKMSRLFLVQFKKAEIYCGSTHPFFSEAGH